MYVLIFQIKGIDSNNQIAPSSHQVFFILFFYKLFLRVGGGRGEGGRRIARSDNKSQASAQGTQNQLW